MHCNPMNLLIIATLFISYQDVTGNQMSWAGIEFLHMMEERVPTRMSSSSPFASDLESTVSDEVFGFEMLKTPLNKRIGITVPGTKWCGLGNNADTNNSLGIFRNEDKCCRSHDLCPDFMLPFYGKHDLINFRPHTRLHCQCDEEFRSCLKSVNSKLSNSLGTFYFTILGTTCYRKDFPIKSCKKYSYYLWRKICVDYEYDLKASKVYQWFDLPFY